MAESPETPWTMARFLDEEFGPPMLYNRLLSTVTQNWRQEGQGGSKG